MQKVAFREYVKSLGLHYTFIEGGWWLTNTIPFPHRVSEQLVAPRIYYGDKQKRTAYTTFGTLAALVPKIVVDERTLDQTVMLYDGEMTLGEAYAWAEKVSGEDFSDFPQAS